MNTLTYWLKGIRIYIAIASLIVTGLTIWCVQVAYGGTSLATIRMQEIFAWVASGLLVTAVAIGPSYKLVPRLKGRAVWFDARRLIGISAAWFASLHVGIAYIVLFKAVNPFSLPSNYQTAFILGFIALLILLAMAFTSFNKAFKVMGIWWFRLHRLVYAAIVLILLHMFMIGVHSVELPVLYLLSVLTAVLIAGYITLFVRSTHRSHWQLTTIAVMAVLLITSLGYGFHQHFNSSFALSSTSTYTVKDN